MIIAYANITEATNDFIKAIDDLKLVASMLESKGERNLTPKQRFDCAQRIEKDRVQKQQAENALIGFFDSFNSKEIGDPDEMRMCIDRLAPYIKSVEHSKEDEE